MKIYKVYIYEVLIIKKILKNQALYVTIEAKCLLTFILPQTCDRKHK